MRVHRRWFDQLGDLDPGCFQNHPKKTGGMSTDWSRYATPEETRDRALRSDPADNAVLALGVGAVRAIPAQIVVHAPIQGELGIPDNRAHAEVFGPKNAESRVHFLRIYRLVLALDSR
ncbi:MAG TPA: hypothetical protein VH482_36905 [Thermomicrobiales bacterium]|jgi:hypothetical protein